MRTLFASLSFTLLLSSSLNAAPEWSRDAIWYQIFVERFRNGDPKNDPTPTSMEGAYPGYVPDGWKITPWHQDWYERDAWAKDSSKHFHELVAARRYGGDLQGVLDKLDYLQDLGITALYFNPLNDSPSLHKYDARHYRHIDRHFGPDPEGDTAIIDSETPSDPSTWKWTAADRLFLQLIKEVHQRGMRLIVDYSWNHTGITFWAWQDLQKHQSESAYRDWYDIETFDDPKTPENEFRYHGWLGVKTLPELKKVDVSGKRDGHPFEGDLHPAVKQHVFHLTKRWLDPNGDGDPSDGVDGFRLDVAHHVPMGFWRDYRKCVHRINPDALLLGEAWWTKWPDQLMDPRPFLRGNDVFDSVMHYQWYRPARRFFAQANGGLTPSQFVSEIDRVYEGYTPEITQSLMNLVASHDSPRFATSFQNKQAYKFKMGARGNPDLQLGSPSSKTRQEMRLMWLHQFSFLSAPHIWNGDEFGMWGADDPDCRKPIIWPDIDHAPETYRPDGKQTAPATVAPALETHAFLKKLIAMRLARPELKRGLLEWLAHDDKKLTLAYSRHLDKRETLVAFNRSDRSQTIALPKRFPKTSYQTIISTSPEGLAKLDQTNEQITFQLAPLQAAAISNKLASE